MSSFVGQVVNALALVGAVGVLAVIVRVLWSKHKAREDAAEAAFSARMREDIDDRAQTEQEAIEAALNSDHQADELAKLGNERRGG